MRADSGLLVGFVVPGPFFKELDLDALQVGMSYPSSLPITPTPCGAIWTPSSDVLAL